MNKFLRYSLSLVLAFVASVTFAQEVTFDFAETIGNCQPLKNKALPMQQISPMARILLRSVHRKKHTILHQTMPSSMEKRTHISTFLSLTLM